MSLHILTIRVLPGSAKVQKAREGWGIGQESNLPPVNGTRALQCNPYYRRFPGGQVFPCSQTMRKEEGRNSLGISANGEQHGIRTRCLPLCQGMCFRKHLPLVGAHPPNCNRVGY